MTKEIFVITQKGCEGCEALKKEHPELNYVDVSDPRVTRLADRLGVEFTPAIVEVDGDKLCLLDDNLKPRKCVRT